MNIISDNNINDDSNAIWNGNDIQDQTNRGYHHSDNSNHHIASRHIESSTTAYNV